MNQRPMANKLALGAAVVALLILVPVLVPRARPHPWSGFRAMASQPAPVEDIFGSAEDNSRELIQQGRQVFRFDTFGDEAFWGDQLHLHEAIATLTPRQVLGLGLKVDADALPPKELQALLHGRVNLDDPAVTLRLLQQNAVLGVTGFFDNGTLRSVGIQCAICHSTVDDSVAPGVGVRIDGLANRDLNVGAIVAAAPNLQPVVDLLRLADPTVDAAAVRNVLLGWGPGKFDAELFLDGKTMTPDQKTAATLLPNARGLAGHNLHTWTGGGGSLAELEALVAVDAMDPGGAVFDARLAHTAQFPVAAAAGLGHVSVGPDDDRVTSKLPALHFYQLALPAPKPRPGIDFDVDAAGRGDELFSGKANCNSCHHEPLWTEPGWNDHK